MSITREQVADLHPGDVVELRRPDWPGTVVAGPLREVGAGLELAWLTVRASSGQCLLSGIYDLTVISRAPRPLYVNHDRTEPVPGDVVRDAEVLVPAGVWLRPWDNGAWIYADRGTRHLNSEMPTRLRLLVDGETGEVVQ